MNTKLVVICVLASLGFSGCVTHPIATSARRTPAISPPVGTVIAYLGDAPPAGDEWIVCDGTWLPIYDYLDLFRSIGWQYGKPASMPFDHFRLPDLRGLFLRGSGQNVNFDPGPPRSLDPAGKIRSELSVGTYQRSASPGGGGSTDIFPNVAVTWLLRAK